MAPLNPPKRGKKNPSIPPKGGSWLRYVDKPRFNEWVSRKARKGAKTRDFFATKTGMHKVKWFFLKFRNWNLPPLGDRGGFHFLIPYFYFRIIYFISRKARKGAKTAFSGIKYQAYNIHHEWFWQKNSPKWGAFNIINYVFFSACNGLEPFELLKPIEPFYKIIIASP